MRKEIRTADGAASPAKTTPRKGKAANSGVSVKSSGKRKGKAAATNDDNGDDEENSPSKKVKAKVDADESEYDKDTFT
jgi:hypothetical protein